MPRNSGDKIVKSKTIALAASAFVAVVGLGAAVAQTSLPSIAKPKPAEGRTLTHASGYSITIPNDWMVATDAEGVDFAMGNPDLSIICQTFHQSDVIDLPDEAIRQELATTDLGETIYTKLLFGDAPGLTYLSTSVQPDHPSGWPFQRAIANATLDNAPMTAYVYVTFKAKSVFYGGCYTSVNSIEAGKAAMDGVINAIRMTK
jgi:hypothetical protein